MDVRLKLEPVRDVSAPVEAWLLTGRDPRQWLATLKTWNARSSDVVLRPIPTSAEDSCPCAVLVTIPSRSGHPMGGSRPGGGRDAVGYVCRAGRVYVPADAQLVPPVSDEELKSLLPRDASEFVWHPALGLIRIRVSDRWSVADLIGPRPRSPRRWDRAVPGTSFAGRLISIEPAVQPTADDVIRMVSGDIGGQRGSIEELPPQPGEGLSGKIHDLLRPIRKWFGLPRRPGSQPPGGTSGGVGSGAGAGGAANEPGWAMLGLAALAAVGESLASLIPRALINQERRQREIDRLMHLLKTDPEAGLRYALPIGGDRQSRGIANPSNSLAERNLDFSLGSLGGGGPVDAWFVPPNQQLQLQTMYRQLAAREVQLGRHRRAAYIYAELLGNVADAATTLEAGRHFREAAVLFRDRLLRPHDAARCLESGGFLEEAALLFVKLNMREHAADLYLRLEQRDEAERLLREVVQDLVRDHNYLKAAEITCDRLNDVNGGLALLETGWTEDRLSAEPCLKQVFVVLNTHARHDEARARIQSLRAERLPLTRAASAARTLCRVAGQSTDQAVRSEAANVTRVIVARELPQATAIEASALLESIRNLVSADVLLGRDCDRYLRQLTPACLPHRAPRRSNLVVVGTDELPATICWCSAQSVRGAVAVAGFAEGDVFVRILPTKESTAGGLATWSNLKGIRSVLLVPGNTPRYPLLVHAIGTRMLADAQSSTTIDALAAGVPDWVSEETVAITGNGTFCWRVNAVQGGLELATISPQSDVVHNHFLAVPFDPRSDDRVSISVRIQRVRLAVGNRIVSPGLTPSTPPRLIEVDGAVTQVLCFRDEVSGGVLALFKAWGGIVFREPLGESGGIPIAEHIAEPVAALLNDQYCVIAGRQECEIYSIGNLTGPPLSRYLLDSAAVAVCPMKTPGQCAVICENGRVLYLQFRK